MRVFIAIDFEDEVVKEIARVQEELSKKNFQGKLTELENLHLTLKFLGEIDEKKVEDIKKRLQNLEFKEFLAHLGQVGAFNFRGSPKMVWVKINGDGIFEIQKKIDNVLKDLFKVEERFMGHLTIARVKYTKDKTSFMKCIQSLNAKPISFKINKIKLKVSELDKIGPVYRDLEVFHAKS